MIAPFEHLLRNSIVHGLENDIQRERSGKNPIGEIRLNVRQESNEVVFEFSDDGAGLNFSKLREKAIAKGAMRADESVTVRPEIAGRIGEIRFQEGSRVAKGDVLVRLDQSELGAVLASSKAQAELEAQRLVRAEDMHKKGFSRSRRSMNSAPARCARWRRCARTRRASRRP